MVVRQFGVEEGVPEQGEDLDQAGILEAGISEAGCLPDQDQDHNLLHLGEVGHRRLDHILQEVDLDQAGNFLEEHRVGGLLVELGLIVNWEGAVGVVA